MLFPTLLFEKITDIQPDDLDRIEVDALLLDVDNTLSSHGCPEPAEGVQEWVKKMQKAGKKLIVVSNNSRKRVEPFAKRLGLMFTSRSLKPWFRGFWRALSLLGVVKKRAAIVGDQIFTDVLGGNWFGMKTILIKPIKPEDGWFFKLKRRVERRVLSRYFTKSNAAHTTRQE